MRGFHASSLKMQTMAEKAKRLKLLVERRIAMPHPVIDADTLAIKIAEKIVAERRRTGSYKLSYNDARNLVLAELDAVTPVEAPAASQGMFVTD